MSNHFYDYLAGRVLNFFEKSMLQSGDKYHIQFEKKEQVTQLVEHLSNLSVIEEFDYAKANYKTFCLKVQNLRVIIASTMDGTTPDFLTTLRNKVGTDETPFVDTAILMIHDSSLDSLEHGMTSFAKEGMPFHLSSVEDDLRELMGRSQLTANEKRVIDFVIEKRKAEQTYQEQVTLFDYEQLFHTLKKKQLSTDDYTKFHLFHDQQLDMEDMSNKKIRERLNENYDLFEKVETIHKYGNYEELDKYFDEKGVGKLGDVDHWQKTNFVDVFISHENKEKDKGLEYIESNKKLTYEGMQYWDRPEADTKAKQRIRNIIIFNPDRHRTLNVEFSFSDTLNYRYVEVKPKGTKTKAETSGKKLKINVYHEDGDTTSFCKVVYKSETSGRFEFKIASVACEQEILKLLQTVYKVSTSGKQPHLLIQSELPELILNPDAEEVTTEKLIGDPDRDCFEIESGQKLVIQKTLTEQQDEELVYFQVRVQNTTLPFAVQEEVDRPVPITGFNVWKGKREKQESFKYYIENEKMKIVQGSREAFAQREFKKSLDRERQMVNSEGLYFTEDSEGKLEVEDLDIAPEIREAYHLLLMYFKANDTLPSLALLHEEYKELATNFVKLYFEGLQKLDSEQTLSPQQRDLALVGTIRRERGDKEWLFSPLHPLNLAYQLHLNDMLGEEILGDELLKTLRPTNLLPYVTFSKTQVYRPIEQHQNDSWEWSVYVDQDLPRYEGSRSFINKLVHEKIEEFTGHFSYLFTLDRRSPLKINVINMGDCQEVMQGLFEYYKKQMKEKVSKADLLPIELHIYAEAGTGNVFEDFSHFSEVAEIEKRFDLNLNISDEFMAEELLNIFREKVSFYSKDVEDKKYEYSHIAFYQMRKIEEMATSSMSEIVSGVSLFGLMSGVPSVFINGNYKTGFGTKYYRTDDVLLLQLVPKLNAFLRVARKLDNYQEGMGLVTAISANEKRKLDRVYESAHWVTFVEPRVDLSFFKNDEVQKDLLVIHYSDQYTSSSGFDAITVTRRSSQYQQLIEEFLKSHEIEIEDKTLPQTINFFNAMNGNWLLRLLAYKNHFDKEKISILSAVKVAMAGLHHPDILWIPISMEEVLRISGGTGLRQKEGLFSAKNLGQFGSYSDDILLIGLEQRKDELCVHLYPIEVKIGSYQTDKAFDQVKKTRKLLYDFLIRNKEENPFRSKMYRNFFMQLAIISAEKMKLYDIWPEQNWELVTDHVNRERLLNDDYMIVDELQQYVGLGAIIAFAKEVHFRSAKLRDEVFLIEYPELSGYKFLVQPMEKMKEDIQSGQGDIRAENLLSNCYKADEKRVEEILEVTEATEEKVDVDDAGEIEVQPQVETHVEPLPAPVNDERKESTKPLEILFGHNAQTGQEVKWFPTSTDKVMHTNTGIIGTMGTGKTQFTKSLITQLQLNSKDNVDGTQIGLLIFDYKGDYIKDDFKKATGARVYDLYHLPYNPLSLYVTEPFKPLLPVHTSSALTDTISTAFNLGNVQTSTLKDLIMEAYAEKGIQRADRSTWSTPAPTMSDLYDLYVRGEGKKGDSLYAVLKDLNDFEIFEPDATKTISLFDMIEGITVINLSGYNESIQNLVVAITLDVFYNQMQKVGHSKIEGNLREITRMILVDEADNFLSKDFTSIKKILKEGREFGVGTILSTQFLSHFSTDADDYAKYVLTWIVHNVAELSSKDIRMIFNTQTKNEEENIMSRIKSLEKHYSVVKGVANQPIWMKDKAFWELCRDLGIE